MSSLHMSGSSLEAGLRWTARLLSALLVGLVVLIYVGEGGFNPLKLSAVEAVQKVFFFTAVAGMVIAWRWEVIGGILATAGILLFFGTEFAVTGGFPKGWAFRLMLLPGIFFLLSALIRRQISAG
jgi:hypothetical protein